MHQRVIIYLHRSQGTFLHSISRYPLEPETTHKNTSFNTMEKIFCSSCVVRADTLEQNKVIFVRM